MKCLIVLHFSALFRLLFSNLSTKWQWWCHRFVLVGGFWSHDCTESRELQQNHKGLDALEEVGPTDFAFLCWLLYTTRTSPDSSSRTVCQAGTRVFHPCRTPSPPSEPWSRSSIQTRPHIVQKSLNCCRKPGRARQQFCPSPLSGPGLNKHKHICLHRIGHL